MRALAVIAMVATVAGAEPKSTRVDVKPFKDKVAVLQDSDGNTYVVKPYEPGDDKKPAVDVRVFFAAPGTKELYEQANTSRGTDGANWSQSLWAPRIPQANVATIQFKDGSYTAWCHNTSKPLTQITGAKANAVLDRPFMTEYMVRRAYLLARDDAGVYYYVDKFATKYGGKGYRVFIGRKANMKQVDLTDVASDSAGEVFSTKTGDLRLTHTVTNEASTDTIVWVRGEKKTPLIVLDIDVNSAVIWSDLGVYKFLGTMCDNL